MLAMMTLFASSTFSPSGNFFQDLFLFVCMYATISTPWHMCGDASEGWEKTLDFLELEIQVAETRLT